MNKFELSKIGDFHINHNEDASAITEIGENKVLIAVMDGCSMGKESHFASTLIAKILRKVGKEISYRIFAEKKEKTAEEYLKHILNRLFDELLLVKNQLLLEREEVLSTLILGVFDKDKNEINLIIIGDGLVCCNGQLYEFEQEDKPDYLGYHLLEEFDSWFQNQHQKLNLKNVVDVSIATDGIFSFKPFDNNVYEKTNEEQIVNELLVNQKWNDQTNMLHRKLLEIENGFGLRPSDDLTILRLTMK